MKQNASFPRGRAYGVLMGPSSFCPSDVTLKVFCKHSQEFANLIQEALAIAFLAN